MSASSVSLSGPGSSLELVSDGTNYHVISRGSSSAGGFTEVHGFNLAIAGTDLELTSVYTVIVTGLLYFQNSGILINVSASCLVPPVGQTLLLMILKNGVPILSTPLTIGPGVTSVQVDAGFLDSPPSSPPMTPVVPVAGALDALAGLQESPPVSIAVDVFTIAGLYVQSSPPMITGNAQNIFVELCNQY